MWFVTILTCLCIVNAASWSFDTFKNESGGVYKLDLPTVIVQGPDLRYYVGGKGRIDVLQVDTNYVVSGHCETVGIEAERTVMGITFDPRHYNYNDVLFFASTSILDFAGGPSAIPDPLSWMWANGRVDVFRSKVDSYCMARVGSLVTGLPVSNHNHGVNGLTVALDGRLLVSNGGMTNAGHSEKGDGDGGYPASPLSGALLEVDFAKQKFVGNVLYTVPDGRRTQIRNRPDVRIYASGFMNAWSVRVHSNGRIYMVDNGPNPGYGKQSTGCDTQLDIEPHYADKFLLVQRGKWYGHPNRNRGRYLLGEARQCIFQPLGTTNGGKEPELSTIESSSNGLVEYTSAIQGTSYKGAMCFARIGFDQKGGSFALKLNTNGNALLGREEIFTENGGLDMTMDRLGSLVLTEFMGGYIKVFRATPLANSTFHRASVALVSVLPTRGPMAGGNLVIVTAKLPRGALRSNVAVWFGMNPAEIVSVNTDTGTIVCKAPAGNALELVHVTVNVNDVFTQAVGNGDYRYMTATAGARLPRWLLRMRRAQVE